jgi:hypothetical protein
VHDYRESVSDSSRQALILSTVSANLVWFIALNLTAPCHSPNVDARQPSGFCQLRDYHLDEDTAGPKFMKRPDVSPMDEVISGPAGHSSLANSFGARLPAVGFLFQMLTNGLTAAVY